MGILLGVSLLVKVPGRAAMVTQSVRRIQREYEGKVEREEGQAKERRPL